MVSFWLRYGRNGGDPGVDYGEIRTAKWALTWKGGQHADENGDVGISRSPRVESQGSRCKSPTRDCGHLGKWEGLRTVPPRS